VAGFFPDLCSVVSKASRLSMKLEICAGVFRVRDCDRFAVQGEANLWSCLTERVADSGWETWKEGAGMWTDPEKEKRSGVARVLV